MRKICLSLIFLFTFTCFYQSSGICENKDILKVVTTLPDYAFFAEQIGKERVLVTHIVHGDQDAHFIRPKPSFVTLLRDVDVLIATGLDLELWLPTIIDKSGNTHIRSGQRGYVSAAHDMNLLEKPVTISRVEGGVHIYGNPHVTCSPINMKIAARNIATGLIKNDPEGKEIYLANLKDLLDEIDRRLFGEELVQILGGDTLCSMVEKGTVMPFLKKQKLHDKPLIDYLGGWMEKTLSLRGTPIVTYHKNWIYFLKLFGFEEAGTIEPKPGIPPSPKHVANLVELMRARDLRVILAANYFDEQKIRTVANRVNAKAVIVPLYVGGEAGINDYFQLVDFWIDGLITAYREKGLLSSQ